MRLKNLGLVVFVVFSGCAKETSERRTTQSSTSEDSDVGLNIQNGTPDTSGADPFVGALIADIPGSGKQAICRFSRL